MFKLLRIALFSLPLVGGVAFAQGSGTSGSAGAPGSTLTPPVTGDTRTPPQQKAGRVDDTTPALPGDATKPVEIPNTVKDSNRAGMSEGTDMNTPGSQATDKKIQRRRSTMPDEKSLPRKSDSDRDTTSTTTKTDSKVDSDTHRDQLNSDK